MLDYKQKLSFHSFILSLHRSGTSNWWCSWGRRGTTFSSWPQRTPSAPTTSWRPRIASSLQPSYLQSRWVNEQNRLLHLQGIFVTTFTRQSFMWITFVVGEGSYPRWSIRQQISRGNFVQARGIAERVRRRPRRSGQRLEEGLVSHRRTACSNN